MQNKITHQIINISKREIISLDEVKNYLRITDDFDNMILESLQHAAISAAENFTGLSIYQRSILICASNAPKIISIKYKPIMELESVRIITDGEIINIINLPQLIDEQGGKLSLKSEYYNKQIEIKYVAGFNIENIPAPITQGILRHIAAMYDHQDLDYGFIKAVKELYQPYRKIKI